MHLAGMPRLNFLRWVLEKADISTLFSHCWQVALSAEAVLALDASGIGVLVCIGSRQVVRDRRWLGLMCV